MLVEGFGESLRNRMLSLRSFPAMTTSEERALAVIAERARYRQFSQGDYLLSASEKSEVVYFLIEGLVESRLGRRVIRVSPGHGVGLLAALCRDGAGTDAMAMEECIVLEVPTEDFLRAHEVSYAMLRTSLRVLAMDLVLEQGGLPTQPSEPEASLLEGRGTPLTFAERLLGSQHNLIGKTSLLAAMDAASLSQEVIISKGDTLWECGAPADYLLRVDSGVVRCTPRSSTAADVSGPVTLGRLELVGALRRGYGAVALTDLHCFRFAGDDFFALLETHPKVGMQLLTTVARQLRATSLALQDERALL